MTGRERFLTALNNQKPDRLPCQVHSWMGYYLNRYLNGMDQYDAYEFIGMDPVIYAEPVFEYAQNAFSNWQYKQENIKTKNGTNAYHATITTPKGAITQIYANNEFTTWTEEHWIKTEQDFEIWNEFVPVPIKVDWTPVIEAKKRIGDKGIVRGSYFDFGQGSPWQSLSSVLFDTEQSIFACFDKPDWVHYMLEELLQKKLRVIELGGKIELDLVETGGGGGSSTLISPNMHREFCLPYDKRQHSALKGMGASIVYHLCGGLMPLLETVAENGADGLETMTPASMGGDCDLAQASKRVGDKLFFIGGFDQNEGFEKGAPDKIREMVYDLHSKCPDGGYICSPSDHFFFGDPENIKAFVDAAKNCKY